MYVAYSYFYFRKYKNFSDSSTIEYGNFPLSSEEAHVQELLNDVLKNCLWNSAIVNAVIFSYFLDFGVIHEEYRWIIALFIYAFVMMGLSMSLFDFLIAVRADMKARNKRNLDG
jgi:hypothetical protein